MKIKSALFNVSAPDLRSCPKLAMPEVAFIGRSNVGKSSLINLLTERRDLAMVSDKPGKTKLINFFTINSNWSLVDLPGYGYAKVSQEQRADFNRAVADYLEKRTCLRGIFVLIDSRHPPQAIDLEFIRWLDTCTVPFALIFTKTDKETPNRVKNHVALFQQALDEVGIDMPEIFPSSIKTKAGRSAILAQIDQWLKAKVESPGA
jgi:GTP-binding protein